MQRVTKSERSEKVKGHTSTKISKCSLLRKRRSSNGKEGLQMLW